MTEFTEHPVVFDSDGIELIGIVATPAQLAHKTGVVVVVGGPQYRVGSHRQFTLLCRELAGRGIASFRFDYHGLGDSAGPPALGVEGVENDMRAAIDAFMAHTPGLRSTVLWGICGAASASALYAPSDRRVAGLVMLNPWVRTESGLAKAQLRYYYLSRLVDPEFWHRIVRGDVALMSSIPSFARNLLSAARTRNRESDRAMSDHGQPLAPEPDIPSLPDRMLDSLHQANLPVLLILSGQDDLTANEFRQLSRDSRDWRRWTSGPSVEWHEISGSNHTFARSDWRGRVEDLTARWVLAH
ncbi:MAG: hydrolase 1, exosortase A system-associated [Rubrivivax sp.]|nr:hydrolase 1, exosortase A system-associated [Rubrivivax sp.]